MCSLFGSRVAMALVLVFALAGCSARTAILLRITSPLAIPADVDGLSVRIRGETTGAVVDRAYPISSWPNTLSLRPGATEASQLTITVTGTRAGAPVVTRVVRASFVAGSEQVVEVVLPADCAFVVCAEGVDCVMGRCVTDSDAGPGDGGMDGGPRDGGPDTGLVDMGLPDAYFPDTGPRDAGCAGDGECDDGVACTHDVCSVGACEHVPDDLLCAVGTTCDPVVGCPPRACTMASECQDGTYCNGMELCVADVCASGDSPCDDADGCTTDACDEAADSCTHRTRDADMDGAGDAMCPATGGVPNTDCNDGDPDINPTAPDTCDGLDNDCSGVCDAPATCCRGTSGSCMTTCGSTGSRVCGATCGWSICSPPAEICNGMDDDCNTACDDGFACCAGRATNPCTTACDTLGTAPCGSDCTLGTCTPPAEVCNGRDDNCDSVVDEGFMCRGGATQPCTTSCGSAGTQTCNASCTFDACAAPLEACNMVDDDCDGMIDEGCGACSACAGATTVTGGGGRYMVPLTTALHTGTCGGAGSEGALTFTLAVDSDVFIATHASSINTVVYVRSCSCAGPEEACNDDADGRTTSALHLTNLAAGTYNVFVDSTTASSGTVPVDVYITAPGPASDRCGNPTFVTAGATSISGTTCGFGRDYDANLVSGAANCPYSLAGDAEERVFYFYVPTTRTVTLNGCNAGTSFDSTLYIRSVCNDAAPAAQLVCNDDGCGGPLQCDRAVRSTASVMLTPGLYYLFVDGYFNAASATCPCGPYNFTLTGF